MKKIILVCAMFMAVAFFSMPAGAADWHFPVGLTYVSGTGDIVDLYKYNLEAEGYIVDTSWEVPVGLSFQPYVELEKGIRIGSGLGPISAILSTEAEYYDVPVNLNAGYVFFPSANTSPYIRGGLIYHIAGGDYVKETSLGFIGTVGIEFFRKKAVGFGIEAGYDSSEIEFDKYRCTSTWAGTCSSYVKDGTEKIKPGGLIVSIFAVF